MLKELYANEVILSLKKTFGHSNPMLIPGLSKVCLNVGLGEAVSDSSALSTATNELSLIAGQRATITYAKRSIASFKLREGMPIGCKVTLRKDRMYTFLERLIYVALPRERDFSGFHVRAITCNGNFSFSVKEHIVFPEVDYDKIHSIFGINVTIVTTAPSADEARVLLSGLGIPFYE